MSISEYFSAFCSVYAGRFEVNLDSPRFGYFTQSAVVKNLCEAVNAAPEDRNLLTLFVHVADHFLKLDVSRAEGGRHNTVSFYTLTLSPDQPVLEYRKMLWSQFYQIYQRGAVQDEIEQILYRYGMPCYNVDAGLDVVRAEFEDVLKFFDLFQLENLFHCVIAAHIKQVAKRIDYSELDILTPFLNSEKYKIYSALAPDFSEYDSEEYEKGIQRHQERVCKLVERYTPRDIDGLIQVCLESCRTFDKEESELGTGLEYAFEALRNQQQLYLYLAAAYMKADTPYKIYAGQILVRLFEIKPVLEVKELSCERRRKAVEKFLSLNADPDAFERLPLEPSYCGGSGSMIPYMQERIEYLRSLLPLVSGIKYLKQKQRIESEIGCWKERIHSEEVRELLESWYC